MCWSLAINREPCHVSSNASAVDLDLHLPLGRLACLFRGAGAVNSGATLGGFIPAPASALAAKIRGGNSRTGVAFCSVPVSRPAIPQVRTRLANRAASAVRRLGADTPLLPLDLDIAVDHVAEGLSRNFGRVPRSICEESWRT